MPDIRRLSGVNPVSAVEAYISLETSWPENAQAHWREFSADSSNRFRGPTGAEWVFSFYLNHVSDDPDLSRVEAGSSYTHPSVGKPPWCDLGQHNRLSSRRVNHASIDQLWRKGVDFTAQYIEVVGHCKGSIGAWICGCTVYVNHASV